MFNSDIKTNPKKKLRKTAKQKTRKRIIKERKKARRNRIKANKLELKKKQTQAKHQKRMKRIKERKASSEYSTSQSKVRTEKNKRLIRSSLAVFVIILGLLIFPSILNAFAPLSFETVEGGSGGSGGEGGEGGNATIIEDVLYSIGNNYQNNLNHTTDVITNNFTNDLIGYWKLNEENGNYSYDSSGNNITGTLVNMEDEDWIPAKLNNGMIFDGINECIAFNNETANFERNETFSTTYWFKTNSTGTVTTLARMEIVAPYRGWTVYLANGLINVLFINDLFAPNYIHLTSTNSYNDGQYHQYTITYNGSSLASGFNIYVDGIYETPIIVSDTLLNTTKVNDINFTIGSIQTIFYIEGIMDDVALYNRTLTQEEAVFLYNLGLGNELDNFNKSYTKIITSYIRFNKAWVYVNYLVFSINITLNRTLSGGYLNEGLLIWNTLTRTYDNLFNISILSNSTNYFENSNPKNYLTKLSTEYTDIVLKFSTINIYFDYLLSIDKLIIGWLL